MKICYIILTCEKFLNTRTKWQRECCFKNVDSSSYYYLSCKPGPNSVYGWNNDDNYESCPWKYIEFFKNMDLEYDWYVFLDDDAFIFPNRMFTTLSKIDKTQSYYIGCKMGHLENLEFMSGGAGFVLSKSAYLLVKQYVRKNDMKNVQNCREQMIHGDVSIGQWIRNINKIKEQSIILKNDEIHFSYLPHQNDIDLYRCETFHYLKTKEQYEFYGSLH